MQKKITREQGRQILRCHKEGWFHDNIARICRCSIEDVEQVLKEKGIQM